MSKRSFSPPVNEIQETVLMAGFSYQAYQFIIGPDMNLPSGSRHLYTFYTPNHEYIASIIETDDVGQEKAYVLIFCGTETSILHPIDTVKDIHVDWNLIQAPCDSLHSNAKVHGGYKELYKSLFTRHLLHTDQSIIDVINTLDSERPLYITGHSLGGALATFATVDIMQNASFKKVKVYTFASPRVGNASFVSSYNDLVPHTVRVGNTNDYVPFEPQVQIPFQEPLYYYHVKGKFSVDFNTESIIHNHSITHYFHSLANQEPSFYEELYSACPQFCPPQNPPILTDVTKAPPQSGGASQANSQIQVPSLPATSMPEPSVPATLKETSRQRQAYWPAASQNQANEGQTVESISVTKVPSKSIGVSTKYPTIFIQDLRVPHKPRKVPRR